MTQMLKAMIETFISSIIVVIDQNLKAVLLEGEAYHQLLIQWKARAGAAVLSEKVRIRKSRRIELKKQRLRRQRLLQLPP